MTSPARTGASIWPIRRITAVVTTNSITKMTACGSLNAFWNQSLIIFMRFGQMNPLIIGIRTVTLPGRCPGHPLARAAPPP